MGFLDELTMFSLTFEEFCLACGTPRSLIELVKQAIVSREAVPDFIHQKLIELHARYLLVGGLPEPVQRFLDTNDLVALRRAHKGDLRFSRLESSFDWFGRLASRCPRCAWASRAFPYPSMRTARPSSST